MSEELTREELLEQNAKMKAALHEVDRYCNTVRTNYRSGAGEEIVASSIKALIREFLHT